MVTYIKKFINLFLPPKKDSFTYIGEIYCGPMVKHGKFLKNNLLGISFCQEDFIYININIIKEEYIK